MSKKYTYEYPKDIKPLLIDKNNYCVYDEKCLREAGYEYKGKLYEFIDQSEDETLYKIKEHLDVWGKDSSLIILINCFDGTLQYSGFLNKNVF